MERKLVLAEFFESVQGEGHWTGAPSLFVRFAGCNRQCAWCDTNHAPTLELTVDELLEWIRASSMRHVVLTGGEPLQQVDRSLLDALLALPGKRQFQIETNGDLLTDTLVFPHEPVWITVSPKGHLGFNALWTYLASEVKVPVSVHAPSANDLAVLNTRTNLRWLQPVWVEGDREATRANYEVAIRMIKAVPSWRINVQAHRLLGLLDITVP